eukprot:13128370-Alexandrium_andersonii.AAC.1
MRAARLLVRPPGLRRRAPDQRGASSPLPGRSRMWPSPRRKAEDRSGSEACSLLPRPRCRQTCCPPWL